MEQQQEAQWEERCRKEQEEEEEREALQIQEEELRLEMQRIAKKGYQDKVKKKSEAAVFMIPSLQLLFNIKICLKSSLSDSQQATISLDMRDLPD